MNARHPEMRTSRTPKIVGIVAAVVVTVWLFDAVASLATQDASTTLVQSQPTVVAQSADTPIVR